MPLSPKYISEPDLPYLELVKEFSFLKKYFSIVTFLVAVLGILPTDLTEEKEIRC